MMLPQITQPARHCPASEYAAFLARHVPHPITQRDAMYHRNHFVREFPDLREWFVAPLAVRVGRVHDGTCIHRVSYTARPYLQFLAYAGYITLDWEWLIALPKLHIESLVQEVGAGPQVDQLIEEAVQLGYQRLSAARDLHWTLYRLALHRGSFDVRSLTDIHCQEVIAALRSFRQRDDVADFWGSRRAEPTRQIWTAHAPHVLQVVLYHRGQSHTQPGKLTRVTPRCLNDAPSLSATVDRFLARRALTDAPGTVDGMRCRLRGFLMWLTQNHPNIPSFTQVTRDMVQAFAEALKDTSPHTGKPLTAATRWDYLRALAAFFRMTAEWEWEDVPSRPLLIPADFPKKAIRLPRFIPDDELTRLMTAVKALLCPYQRTALLVARWSGARRDEIQRLPVDCLDTYRDGSPRLRIPAGKTKRERIIPLHEEAAQAIRELVASQQRECGFRDRVTGKIVPALFVHHGKRYSTSYLFHLGLHTACTVAGLVDQRGRATISAHRFRHTVGTQLAERGARLHTIMTILGHTTPSMSLIYAQISDREVLRDYQAVLGPGTALAGPFAQTLRSGELPPSAVDWLKTNFFKTELELGHCLRLPEEGPCECDLYLTCAKFLTTPAYAPRLRHRRQQEAELLADAAQRGWEREVERHRCTIQRVEALLQELGEPLDSEDQKEER